MKIFFPLLLVIIIAGCASKKSFEDIYLNGDKYCLKETESLFTGELILRFESGIVSNRIGQVKVFQMVTGYRMDTKMK